MWSMEGLNEHVLTLANSIIGVSILAMPYCFKQCGILLAIVILLFSNLLSRLSCHFLIKSAIIARRKTFEYLAYYIFGGFGKFAIEVGMIGFLLGTCVAFFVVIGDLGPEIISEVTGQEMTSGMRSTILLALALFCVVPLGLLKNIDSLSGVSKATIGFYFCLVMKITIDALPHIFSSDWVSKVEFWRPQGVIQCLPIFSMALSCQTQLFEIYQIVHNPSLEKMNNVIKNAVNICTLVYFFVGFFGYIAFASKNFTGNILLSFAPSLLTTIIKLGFVLSIAFSFPLVIFPCRASVHSLIYRQGISIHETVNDYIPEGRFKVLTLIIVFISLVIGILIPNIEFVLGLVGSSIGIMICILFPVICFIYISQKDTNERLLAKLILVIGLILMILGTYENLRNLEKIQSPVIPNLVTEKRELLNPSARNNKNLSGNTKLNETKIEVLIKATDSPEIRHEPPQPVEPQDSQPELEAAVAVEIKEKLNNSLGDLIVNQENKLKDSLEKIKDVDTVEKKAKELPNLETNNQIKQQPNTLEKLKNDDVDIEAIKKDDKETLLEQKREIKDPHLEEHKILIDKIQKQNEVQQELVKQQKKLIEVFEKQQEEKVKEDKIKAEIKAVKEIESIALKAIEKISGDVKQNEQIVAELEKNVLQKVNAQENIKDNQSFPNQSKENNKIEELKLMNSFLSAKINQNNISQPINEVDGNKNVIKNMNEDKMNIMQKDSPIVANKTHNNNNTSPLLVNLGQVDNNPSNSVKDIPPLPLIVSYLQQQNASASNSKILGNNSSNIKVKDNFEDKKDGLAVEDVKVMRRDILAYVVSKRKR